MDSDCSGLQLNIHCESQYLLIRFLLQKKEIFLISSKENRKYACVEENRGDTSIGMNIPSENAPSAHVQHFEYFEI